MSTGFWRAAARRFRAAYGTVLARWPVPAAELDLRTSSGVTRVRRCGADGPPLVLLPGANITSLSWLHDVPGLAARHRLYLVDSLGEIGMSVAGRTLPDALANVRWLGELLDELKLADAHLAGVSRGGWLALQFAAHAPQRVRTVTALEPPGLTPFGPRWYPWLAVSGIRAMRTRSYGGPELGPFFAELFRVLPFFRMRVRNPELLTDEQLRGMSVPVHFLLGERSAIGPLHLRARRAALVPDATVDIVPGGAHDFAFRQPGLISTHILRTTSG